MRRDHMCVVDGEAADRLPEQSERDEHAEKQEREDFRHDRASRR